MTKSQLKIFLKAAYEIILVFLQFFIISLHFYQLEFIPQKQIIQVSPLSYLVGFLIIIIAFIILLVAGIYGFTRHPMYYSLIFISVGVFVTKLSIYYLFLSVSLSLIIKFKIALEEQYLNNKFKNYLLYKNEVKY